MPLLTELLQSGRIAMVEEYVRGNVLDLGCGHAPLLDRCAARIGSYVGVDRSRDLVDDCARRHPDHRFECLDLERDRLDLGARFDVVVMLALIEHVGNQLHLFEQVRDSLAPGGAAVLTTPTVWGNDFVHRAGAAIGWFSAEAAGDHCVIYDRRRLEHVAGRVGLRLLRHRTFQFGCNQLAVLARADLPVPCGLLDQSGPVASTSTAWSAEPSDSGTRAPSGP